MESQGGRRLAGESGLVGGLILQTILGFVILGLVLFESGQLLMAQVRAQNAGSAAASAAAESLSSVNSPQRARASADAAAAMTEDGASVTAFEVGTDRSVTVTVGVEAHTLVVHRIGFLRHFAVQHATETAGRHT